MLISGRERSGALNVQFAKIQLAKVQRHAIWTANDLETTVDIPVRARITACQFKSAQMESDVRRPEWD